MTRKAYTAVVQKGGFGLGLAMENESGYYPVVAYPPGSFKTYEEAGKKAQALNAEEFGLSREDGVAHQCKLDVHAEQVMSENFVTEMHDIANRMYEASKYLCEMSLHLGMVGLDKLAGQLEGEAAQLDRDAEKLHLLIGEKVAEDVKNAEQASKNMLGAALAMGAMCDAGSMPPLDTINGFPIIAMWATPARGCDRLGRIFIADRGLEHEERYVVSWQGYDAEKRCWQGWWVQGHYYRDLAEAERAFTERIEREARP